MKLKEVTFIVHPSAFILHPSYFILPATLTATIVCNMYSYLTALGC